MLQKTVDASDGFPSTSSSATSPPHSVAPSPAFVYSMQHTGQVMTEEQLETLRRQISVYATICQQLVEMHKAVMAQQSTIQGFHMAQSVPFDMVLSSGHKVSARQRWTPSQVQLQILERLFEQGNGTPSKQKIKEITLELSHHGQISETNVYNWFQNRRARTKRKQQVEGFNHCDYELDADVDSPEEKKNKMEKENECITAPCTEANFQSGAISDNHQLEARKNVAQSSQLLVETDRSQSALNRAAVHSNQHDNIYSS